ncbi:MAG: hypothetical protein AAF495_29105, partial [Pseudomonadota bacterium]
VVALSLHPPKGGIGALPWQFFAGIVLAAVGGTLVTLYKPTPAPPSAQPAPAAGGSAEAPASAPADDN